MSYFNQARLKEQLIDCNISPYGTFVKICVAKLSVRKGNERAVNVGIRASRLACGLLFFSLKVISAFH